MIKNIIAAGTAVLLSFTSAQASTVTVEFSGQFDAGLFGGIAGETEDVLISFSFDPAQTVTAPSPDAVQTSVDGGLTIGGFSTDFSSANFVIGNDTPTIIDSGGAPAVGPISDSIQLTFFADTVFDDPLPSFLTLPFSFQFASGTTDLFDIAALPSDISIFDALISNITFGPGFAGEAFSFNISASIDDPGAPEVPIPAAIPLFLSGLMGLGFLKKNRKGQPLRIASA